MKRIAWWAYQAICGGVTAGVVAAIALDERNARRNRRAAKAYLPKPRPPWHDAYGTDD